MMTTRIYSTAYNDKAEEDRVTMSEVIIHNMTNLQLAFVDDHLRQVS